MRHRHVFKESAWWQGALWERCKCGEKQIVRYGAPVETENDVFEWPEEIEEVLC